MKIYRMLLFTVTFGFILALSGCGGSQQQQAVQQSEQPKGQQSNSNQQQTGDIQIMAEDYAPYGYLDKDNNLVGVSAELIKAAMKEENMKNEIKVTPWARIYEGLLNVPNTIAFTCGRTPEREDKFIWIAEVGNYNGIIYGLKDKNIKIKSLDDMKKYKVGTVQDHYTEQHLLKNGFELNKNLFRVQDDAANLEKLYSGRIDVLIANELSISHILKTQKDKFDSAKIEALYDVKDLTVSAYLVASKGTSEDIIKKFQDGFAKIKANGTYKNVINSYTIK